MKTVIGVVPVNADTDQPVQKLSETGISKDRVSVITQENEIKQLINCEPAQKIGQYAALGATIGVAIYGIFGLFAAMCQCNLLQFGKVYGIGTLIGGILAGALVGGFLGALVGVANLEKDECFYIQAIRLGSKVIAVQAGEGEIERVKRVLKRENATGIRAV